MNFFLSRHEKKRSQLFLTAHCKNKKMKVKRENKERKKYNQN